MRKLILGIIALICLDIGFVAYMSADLRAELAVNETKVPNPVDVSADSTVASGTSATENTTDTADVAAVKASPDDISNYRANVRPPTELRMESVKVRSRRKERVLATRNQPLFTPIVFYAPAPSLAEPERAISIKDTLNSKPIVEKQVARYPPKTDNRSLVARVWPVVRKPYDWIKVLGSKFN